ncbi:MAG: cupredoxin domain-containing protein [Anaerolineae bacterium]|jgi:uncharacterized cupredoxin-like copper-binding protein
MHYLTLRRAALGLIAILAVALLVGACGSASGQSGANPAEVQITLSEFKIESSQTTFDTGTPYRFVIKNEGTIAHDWAIMPRGETDTSQALIKVDEDELPPGATVTQEFTFTDAGDWEFACHVPGHYEAGMLLHITVQ